MGTSVTGGGGGAANQIHNHNWSGNITWRQNEFGAHGATDAAANTAAAGYNGTTTVTNVQPSLVIRHLIKT
jgi:hypothetical protein